MNSNYTAKELRQQYGVVDTDLEAIRTFGKIVLPKASDFVDHFYKWLRKWPEFEEFFPNDEGLDRVVTLQVAYYEKFFTQDIDEAYVESRRTVGAVHARIGLPVAIYLAAMNESMRYMTEVMYDNSLSSDEHVACLHAVVRRNHLDTAIVVDTFNQRVQEALAAQSRTLMEMSTPVTQLWEGILMLPVVGIMDSKRAQDMMNAILRSIADTQSQYFILDISGVAVVDTAVANHLIKITKATDLMGCECIITGISPAIAQTIVELGINVGSVQTTAAMKDALATVFRKQGIEQSSVAQR
jgi:rsbT co-antagonist protein RsbR